MQSKIVRLGWLAGLILVISCAPEKTDKAAVEAAAPVALEAPASSPPPPSTGPVIVPTPPPAAPSSGQANSGSNHSELTPPVSEATPEANGTPVNPATDLVAEIGASNANLIKLIRNSQDTTTCCLCLSDSALKQNAKKERSAGALTDLAEPNNACTLWMENNKSNCGVGLIGPRHIKFLTSVGHWQSDSDFFKILLSQLPEGACSRAMFIRNLGHSWEGAMGTETFPLVRQAVAMNRGPKDFLWAHYGGCNAHNTPESKLDLVKNFRSEIGVASFVSVGNQTYDYGEGDVDQSLVGLEATETSAKIDWYPCLPEGDECTYSDSHYQTGLAHRCRGIGLSAQPKWQLCCATDRKDEENKTIWAWGYPQDRENPGCPTPTHHSSVTPPVTH